MIRFLIAFLVIVPATLWYGGRIVWAVSRKRPNAPCVCDESPRKWSRLLLKATGIRVVLEDVDRIDPERPQVLIANHSSWYDVLAIAASLPGRYLFVAKKELEKVWVFGTAMRACGHIFVDRRDRAAAVESLGAARNILEEQNPTIIMFPEGTRSATGEIQPFKKGAFVLAIQTGVEVVPAAISGSRAIMRKGSLMIRSGTITVRFGEPIRVDGYDLERRDELTEQARDALIALQASRTT